METQESQASEDEIINIDILGAGNEDQPASLNNDTLGFRPYVEGVFSFLVNPATVAPFTLSIEGEWGTGKSSFMYQLQQTLKEKNFRTITFNAWRQDKVESMWAAFALHFIKELTKELGHFDRFKANAHLRWKRFDLGKGWLSIAKTTLLLILFLYLTITLLSNFHAFGTVIKDDKVNFSAVLSNLGGAGIIIGILFFLGKVAEVTGNPFKADLQKFINTPNYAGSVAFIEEFHRDFKTTVNILTKDKEKIFVFIDDLDRAEIPKAADLMQGLNMMISDSPRLIFIIGMDREKVAAGVAAKYKDLLPFLNPEKGILNTPESLRQARSFGYNFLEKFIQLSFQVPMASENFAKTFINSLSGSTATSAVNTSPIEYRSMLEITQGKDAQLFRDVVLEVAPFFDYNPRRIKQFVNTFRLKAHIAGSTGLFSEKIDIKRTIDYTENSQRALTIPQLGKFVALIMLWPEIIDELTINPSFFNYNLAGSNLGMGDRWKNKEEFIRLVNLKNDVVARNSWDMALVNIIALVETSAPFKKDKPKSNAATESNNPLSETDNQQSFAEANYSSSFSDTQSKLPPIEEESEAPSQEAREDYESAE